MKRAAGACAACLLLAAAQAGAAAADDLIGAPSYAVVDPRQTLLDIARDHDVGYVDIRLANPDVDPWLPDGGRVIAIPSQHVLPPGARRGIVINLAELRLYFYPPGGEPLSFPIGIGREGAETPVGHTRIDRKRENPSWVPTASEREEDPELPLSVGPGPLNPMGEFALYLGWAGFAIHGTHQPYSVGRRGSHGCIRLYPEDIARLYPLVDAGTPVSVIDLPYKLGWRAGELYVEVHPVQREADRVEMGEMPLPDPTLDLVAPILEALGAEAYRVDWRQVERAQREQNGMPLAVTRRQAPTSIGRQ
ncbi:L,D-transpeptidase family protein [Solimonas soli]|uniref:L,D-transpeptidase family protein n=1 Tax=Solimonas soli TaxID=413479 RepID=UPI0004B09706|nr:L,D-transpeptidase family protein [Solimonas soli]